MAEAKGTLQLDEQVTRLVRLLDTLPPDEQIEKRQDVVRKILAGQDRKIAIADGWESWRTHPNKKHDPKATTLAGYQAILNRFKRWGVQTVGQFPLKRLQKSSRKIPRKFAADKVLGLADPEFEEGIFWGKDRVVSTKRSIRN